MSRFLESVWRNLVDESTGALTVSATDARTIKALAVSQWVEIEYNGTDWVVAAFGSL